MGTEESSSGWAGRPGGGQRAPEVSTASSIAGARGDSVEAALELVGFSAEALSELGPRLDRAGSVWRSRCEVTEEETEDLARMLLEGEAVLALGNAVDPGEAVRLLARVLPAPGTATGRGLALVLAGGERLERFHPFLSADYLFYLSSHLPPPADAASLLRAAAGSRAAQLAASGDGRGRESAEEALAELDEVLRRLEGERSPSRAAAQLERQLPRLVEADRTA
ncbi:MAG: hypothetical protein MI919_12335, partial [Holophagales bacterium]|nr:hypothetical protein [Holophagales bacterium]